MPACGICLCWGWVADVTAWYVQFTGQPVLIGGTMGTCSYVLTGTQKGMNETFGNTCHGAGRACSRSKSRYVGVGVWVCGCGCVGVGVWVTSHMVWLWYYARRTLNYEDVLSRLEKKKICIRVASPKLVMEEAPESYKDVTQVVDTCHAAGISKKTVKLRPIAVVKG